MHLVTLRTAGGPVPGIGVTDGVVALPALEADLPRDWASLLAAERLDRLDALARAAPNEAVTPWDAAELAPPIPQPPKLLCVGLNYHAHAAETGMEVPRTPIVFSRFPSSVVGHGEPIVRPAVSEKHDYEGELAAVIGTPAWRVPAERALDCVAGYTIFNDGTLRDYQKRAKQWTLGKNFDASGACGPSVVTADALPAGGSGLRLTTELNGEVMQDGRTDDLIFSVAALVAAASEVMTLEPGTLIATGTPPGVGMARDPYVWLKPGDTVAVTIEGIGTLRNPVVGEPS